MTTNTSHPITDHHHTDLVSLPPEEELLCAARFLRTLGDPTKLKIVCALSGHLAGAGGGSFTSLEICAGSIAASLGMTKSAVSHQLRLLREEGLIRSRREGKHVIYSLDDDHVHAVIRMTMEHIHHRHAGHSHTETAPDGSAE